MDSTLNPKVKTTEGEGVGVRSLAQNTLGVKGRVRTPRWGLRRLTNKSITHMDLHKPNKLVSAQLEHLWCMDEPRANTDEPQVNTDEQDSPRPRLGGSHHLLPYSILCAWPWDQHPNVILSRDSQMRISKFPKLGFPWFWKPITLCENLWLRWSLNQSCSPCRELSNGMWLTTWTSGNQGDSQLLLAIWLPTLLLAITCVLITQWVMRAHFMHLHSKIFPMI
jgi:hypothetical protein